MEGKEGRDETRMHRALMKLHKSSLKKYKRHFNLTVRPNASKGELVGAIEAHFSKMPVNEEEILRDFNLALSRSRQRAEPLKPPETA
mmetsp:Transcript_868/g.1850  ORF Transcript_868/g.1850 Transcript_868/m.1850 type:complete len:87 (+) Transcript_868:67-327(+)